MYQILFIIDFIFSALTPPQVQLPTEQQARIMVGYFLTSSRNQMEFSFDPSRQPPSSNINQLLSAAQIRRITGPCTVGTQVYWSVLGCFNLTVAFLMILTKSNPSWHLRLGSTALIFFVMTPLILFVVSFTHGFTFTNGYSCCQRCPIRIRMSSVLSSSYCGSATATKSWKNLSF